MSYTDEVAGLRTEMGTGFAAITGKLDGYILAHSSQHSAEQQSFYQHKLEIAGPLRDLTGPPSLEERTRRLEDAKLAQDTTLRTLRGFLVVATGGSVVSALGFVFMVYRAVNQ